MYWHICIIIYLWSPDFWCLISVRLSNHYYIQMYNSEYISYNTIIGYITAIGSNNFTVWLTWTVYWCLIFDKNGKCFYQCGKMPLYQECQNVLLQKIHTTVVRMPYFQWGNLSPINPTTLTSIPHPPNIVLDTTFIYCKPTHLI